MKVYNKIWVIALLLVCFFIAGCDIANSPIPTAVPPSAGTAEPTIAPIDDQTTVPTVVPVPLLLPVNLGSAGNFAILAGSAFTNTGISTITGDIGVSPGSSLTGIPPGILVGDQYVADAIAATAQLDLITAISDAAGRTGATLIATELGGTTLTCGLYNSAAGDFNITGTLILDAQGDSNAVFIFQTASTLVTAGSSSIVLADGAQAQNVFWQVGSSATLGNSSTFIGTILAQASITVTTGATIDGKALANTGAVTLDTDIVTIQ